MPPTFILSQNQTLQLVYALTACGLALQSAKEPFEVIEISFTHSNVFADMRMRAKISTILRWLLETTATKSRRSSSQKEVTHQIVKEQECILAVSRFETRPEAKNGEELLSAAF